MVAHSKVNIARSKSRYLGNIVIAIVWRPFVVDSTWLNKMTKISQAEHNINDQVPPS